MKMDVQEYGVWLSKPYTALHFLRTLHEYSLLENAGVYSPEQRLIIIHPETSNLKYHGYRSFFCRT